MKAAKQLFSALVEGLHFSSGWHCFLCGYSRFLALTNGRKVGGQVCRRLSIRNLITSA